MPCFSHAIEQTTNAVSRPFDGLALRQFARRVVSDGVWDATADPMTPWFMSGNDIGWALR